ncbi:MAG: hypothetical protein IT324_08500 [Anaerolineae bacterium]|nr:hypothetical protein [Anaerolineae bacterium]
MKQSIKYALIVCVFITILVGTPTYAQESATTPAPAGVGILILLMGLGALGLVALSSYAQNRPERDDEAREIDEDEEE